MNNVIHPNRGGLGQSNIPTQGQIAIGDGTGKFTLVSLQALLDAFIPRSPTPPADPQLNQLWVDTS